MRVNEQGRSMIEMLGVLAIVGVLSVGGIAGYSKAMAKFKTNKVIDQITMISTNIRTLYSSQKNFNGLTNQLAKDTNVIPVEMTDSTSTITNQFGGYVRVMTADKASEGDEQAYAVAFSGIPTTACIALATTDWGGDADSGFEYMYIDDSPDTLDEATVKGYLDDADGEAAAADPDGGSTPTTDSVRPMGGATPPATDSGDGAVPYTFAPKGGESAMSVVTATQVCRANNDSDKVFVWKYF